MIDRNEFLSLFDGGTIQQATSIIRERMTEEDVPGALDEAAASTARKYLKAEDSEGVRLFHSLPDEDGKGRKFVPDRLMDENLAQLHIDEQERRIEEIVRKNMKFADKQRRKGIEVQLHFQLELS